MKIPAVTLNTEGAILTDTTVTGGGGGGGLGDYENVVVVAKAGADYSTVATGEAACTTSDMLAIMPGVYNENFTIDVQYVSVVGFGGNEDSGIVLIGGSDDVGPIATLSQDVNLTGLYLSRTLTGGAGAYIGVDGSNGSYFCTLVRCRVSVDGAATGRDVTGVKISGDGTNESHITNSRIAVENESSGEAIDLAGGDVVIEHSEIFGDVVCSAATETRIRSSRIVGDLTGVAGSDLYLQDVEVTGTISGWDSVTVEGAEDDPGANARTLATNSSGQLTLQDLFLPAAGTIGIDSGALITFTATEVVVNEAGLDRDLRVEGDTDANLLFCDGGNDWVGIGTNTPVDKFTVAGTIYSYVASPAFRGTKNSTPTNGDNLFVLYGGGDVAGSIINGGGMIVRAAEDWVNGTNSGTEMRIYVTENGDWNTRSQVAIFTNDRRLNVGPGASPGGRVTIDQFDSSGAIPVLELDQADDSEEFINFISNVGDGDPIDTVNAVGSAYARMRIAVNGTFKYVQIYNA